MLPLHELPICHLAPANLIGRGRIYRSAWCGEQEQSAIIGGLDRPPIVNDANDVIDKITLNGGDHVWTEKRWEEFMPRLAKWGSIWEDTGRRNGLIKDAGHILGGWAPGIADVITTTLWTTITERFSKIHDLFEETAPMTAALCQRVSALPPLTKLAETARKDYGQAYAGGQIGASMARILND